MAQTGSTIVAIVLAAGGGTRFLASRGGAARDAAGPAHKLLSEIGGRPLHRIVVEQALASGIGPVVVVTGAVPLALPDGVVEAHHPGWADGQAGSVRRGLDVAASLGADLAVVGLADQPGVPAAAWRLVAAAPSAWPIVVASYDGRRGPNPVRLHRSLWAELPATGDEGARALMRAHPELVHEVPCPGSAHDIDTLEDLHRWTSC